MVNLKEADNSRSYLVASGSQSRPVPFTSYSLPGRELGIHGVVFWLYYCESPETLGGPGMPRVCSIWDSLSQQGTVLFENASYAPFVKYCSRNIC